MNDYEIKIGNNIDVLKNMADNSIDAIITDPPYGLSFMNKKWDYDVPSVQFWMEVFRVLKPGGHVLSFGGTRTYHRMVVNIEDAGFEIRDQIMWLYGSGFPKSHNISKAIDKVEGNERKVIGKKIQRVDGTLRNKKTNGGFMKENVITTDGDGYIDIEEPGSDNSKEYEGWGTALKPANEPICLARKPLSEKSVAENVLKWRTGGINIEGCRISIEGKDDRSAGKRTCNIFDEVKVSGGIDSPAYIPSPEGRFPANLILECICDEVIKGEKGEVKKTNRSKSFGDNCYGDLKNKDVDGIDNYNDKGDIHTNPMCPCRLMDEQSGVSKSNCKSGVVEGKEANVFNDGEKKTSGHKKKVMVGDYNDKGGASRFFYQAKVSKKERNMGLEGISARENVVAKNTHPTVKPINLMTYLCRMVTPSGGTILDPFMGSGSTGVAARLEGYNFIGIEMDEDYVKIAEARIKNYEKYRDLLK